MSRSGYSDDLDPFDLGRWRQAVKRAITGRRGQALLRELLEALDAMPDKRLFSGNFTAAEGEFCTLGVLGAKRGTKMDDLGNAEDGCDPEIVGYRFGIARAMAAEIMYLNDLSGYDTKTERFELCGPMRWWEDRTKLLRVPNNDGAHRRWTDMRAWVVEHLTNSSVNAGGVVVEPSAKAK